MIARVFNQTSLKINALSNWAAFCINIIIGLILTPYIITSVGKDGYGIWVLVGSFAGYYGLLNLGVGSALLRYAAKYAAEKNDEALNEVASTALTIFGLTGLVVFAGSLWLGNPLAEFFQVPDDLKAEFVNVVWIVGLSTGLTFAGSIFGTIIMAFERFILTNVSSISAGILRAALIVLFIEFQYNIVGIAYATLLITIYEVVLNAYLAKRVAPTIKPNYYSAKPRMVKKLVLYGGVTSVITIADIMRSNLDHVVVAKWVGLEYVAIYGIGLILLRYIVRIITTGMSVLTPRFAKLDGEKAVKNMQALFLKSLSISGFLAFGAAMVAIVFGRYIIVWWVGEEFTESAIILAILSSSAAVAISQNPAIGLMYAIKKHHYYATATIIEAFANLGLSIYLAEIYGMIGVALGTLISMTIVKAIVMPIYVSRLIKIPWLEYIKPIIKPAVVSMALTTLAFSAGLTEIGYSEIVKVVIASTTLGLTYVLANYLLMTEDVQNVFLSFFKMKTVLGRITR